MLSRQALQQYKQILDDFSQTSGNLNAEKNVECKGQAQENKYGIYCQLD